MNAYELADELVGTAKFINNISSQYHAVREINDAATMLRQQADRIAEMEANLKAQVELAHRQADRIDKLMTIAEDYQIMIVKLKEKSHPVKQLSDEEIMEVFDACLFNGGFNTIEFARAIIKEITE